MILLDRVYFYEHFDILFVFFNFSFMNLQSSYITSRERVFCSVLPVALVPVIFELGLPVPNG
jgi:hypothetical protein